MPIINEYQVGAMLKEIRHYADWTQDALAMRIGISLSLAGAIERGDQTPSKQTQRQLQRFFREMGMGVVFRR